MAAYPELQKRAREEEATIEKILAWLNDEKDVRKGNWSPKEVGKFPRVFHSVLPFMMTKGQKA